MTQDRLNDVLATVMDPEIPVLSIVDIGILRHASVAEGVVQITPTYVGCPATDLIAQIIRGALDSAGFSSVAIEVVFAPAWSTEMISEAGRQKLLLYGIAPPDRAAYCVCPRCGSRHTREVSRFGSTPCKALWRCNDCLEPFDRFKCH